MGNTKSLAGRKINQQQIATRLQFGGVKQL
jgi:hypothetical protein